MTLEVDGAGGGAFLASCSGLVLQCQGVVDDHAVVPHAVREEAIAASTFRDAMKSRCSIHSACPVKPMNVAGCTDRCVPW